MTLLGGIGGIQGASAPGEPTNVVAVGGVESAIVSWTVPGSGSSGIQSFIITPLLAGEIALTPVTVPVGPAGSALSPLAGVTDYYTLSSLLIGSYTFTVAAVNVSESGTVGTSNEVAILAPPTLAPPPTVPHLALPLTLGPNGSFNTIQQDTIEEVAQSVEVILGTPLGSRLQVPGFGVPDPVLTELSPSAHQIQQVIAQWEPRALTAVSITNNSAGTTQISVAVELANHQ